MSKYDLEERLIIFSVLIIELTKTVPETVAGSHLDSWLIRSAISSALLW